MTTHVAISITCVVVVAEEEDAMNEERTAHAMALVSMIRSLMGLHILSKSSKDAHIAWDVLWLKERDCTINITMHLATPRPKGEYDSASRRSTTSSSSSCLTLLHGDTIIKNVCE